MAEDKTPGQLNYDRFVGNEEEFSNILLIGCDWDQNSNIVQDRFAAGAAAVRGPLLELIRALLTALQQRLGSIPANCDCDYCRLIARANAELET